ncbi:MAG: hypothetical protein ACI8TX_001493 [Hyphomicrobiaceae bacterium]|jgi:hypothetical protein
MSPKNRPNNPLSLARSVIGAVARTSVAVMLLVAPASAVQLEGKSYSNWSEYFQSEYFETNGKRCGKPASVISGARAADPGDCTFSVTNPTSDYDTTDIYEVKVVVHVIENTGGDGQISDALIQSQIDVLNEDFQAIVGTNGAPGFDTGVQFVLADTDPGGSPTTGITRSVNDTWFNDNDSYWNTLAWDTNVYMNVYTNLAGGNLGYVPDLPQGGLAGNNSDRVVILWSTFGRNAPGAAPFDLGRTLTHEVGHYLGLEHTFNGGCGTSGTPGCYSSGDLICDTNAEQTDTSGCPGNKLSCGSSDPTDNYMDYSDDACMEMFTDEQSHRMRCSLLNYRPNLYSVVTTAVCGDNTREGSEECDGTDDASCVASCQVDCQCPPPVCGNDVIESGEECDGTDPGACPTGTCGIACACPAPACGNDTIESGEECDGTATGSCPTGACDGDCTCPAPVCGNDITEGSEDCDGTDDAACSSLCEVDCICPSTCNDRDLFVKKLVSKERRFKIKGEVDNFVGTYDGFDPRNSFLLDVSQGAGMVSISIPSLDIGWEKRSRPDRGKYIWKGDIGGVRVVKVIDLSEKRGFIRVILVGKFVTGATTIDVSDPTLILAELTMDGACSTELYRK